MKRFPILSSLFLFTALTGQAQHFTPQVRDAIFNDPQQRGSGFSSDSTETTDVPEGIYVWTINPRFGDIRPAQYDTIPHGFQNENFTSGPTGRYNFLGNLGAPRISRLFTDQGANMQTNPFLFKLPYDFFLKGVDQLLFTNTRSPFTNLTYHSCGNKTNGEDRIRAYFAVNAGKRFGMGFKADYLYGRGYYQGQSTAHFDGTLYASYRGDQYQMHALVQHTQLKTRENGGIENDDYVNRPESFPTKYGTADMPINLARAWNKLGGNQVFLTHRYSLGFRRYRDAEGNLLRQDQLPWTEEYRKAHPAPVTPQLLTDSVGSATDSLANQPKVQPRLPRLPEGTTDGQLAQTDKEAISDSLDIRSEFIPVTSFIHTFRADDNTRRFLSNERNNAENPGYFTDFFLPGDSANDRTHHLSIENTFAIELHEGFNKWMKMGLRLFAKHEYAAFDFRLPYAQRQQTKTHFKENYITLGGQILSQQSRFVRYNVLGEIRTTGSDWGEFNVEADANFHIPLRRDSLHFEFNGFVRNERPSFYFRHYRGRNAWWDHSDLNKVFRAHVNATLRYRQTALTASLENIQNYLYFKETLTPFEHKDGFTGYRHAVGVEQAGKNTQLLALTLNQNFHWGVFHWDNELTYQATTNKDVMPLPAFTGYTNVYLLFRIAKVLQTELGADLTYFTPYYAPAYSPIIGQYVVQDSQHRVKVGNYPLVNVYANFHLKRTRFYVMASHVNYSSGAGKPFLVPHNPLNRLTFRIGLSWNFVN